MTTAAIESTQLSREVAYFDAHRAELMSEAPGQFALVKGDALIGTYESEIDAIRAGFEKFGNEAFLVKQIVPVVRSYRSMSGHHARFFTATALVNTGAQTTVVSPDVPRLLGLRPVGSTPMITPTKLRTSKAHPQLDDVELRSETVGVASEAVGSRN
jgi:hypothetical protein